MSLMFQTNYHKMINHLLSNEEVFLTQKDWKGLFVIYKKTVPFLNYFQQLFLLLNCAVINIIMFLILTELSICIYNLKCYKNNLCNQMRILRKIRLSLFEKF